MHGLDRIPHAYIYIYIYIYHINVYINVVCCVGRVEIQIEILKGWCTADMDSKVKRFERWPLVRENRF